MYILMIENSLMFVMKEKSDYALYQKSAFLCSTEGLTTFII